MIKLGEKGAKHADYFLIFNFWYRQKVTKTLKKKNKIIISSQVFVGNHSFLKKHVMFINELYLCIRDADDTRLKVYFIWSFSLNFAKNEISNIWLSTKQWWHYIAELMILSANIALDCNGWISMKGRDTGFWI